VNRHDGGATLLKEPERIFRILSTVRRTVPLTTPVTAKIRLGFDRPDGCIEIAQAVEAAGISTLAVHCRTKTDMYKPPAYWEWIPRIKAATKLNLIANGDIWTPTDLLRCQSETGCTDFMIGRGALSDPFLFRKIKSGMGDELVGWKDIKGFLSGLYLGQAKAVSDQFAISRTKQWISMMSKRNSEVSMVFDRLKIIRDPEAFKSLLV